MVPPGDDVGGEVALYEVAGLAALPSLSSLALRGPIPGDGGGEDVALYEVAGLGALSDPRPTLCRLWPSEPEPQGTAAEAAGLTGKY